MKAALIVLLIVVAVTFGLYARAKHWIDWPPIEQTSTPDQPKPNLGKFQVTGDPPITVSDGSLHVHSKKHGWDKDNAGGDASFNAKDKGGSTKGTLTKGCGMTDSKANPVSAELWTDDMEAQDISPDSGKGLNIVITHDGTTVTITTPPENTAGALNVSTSADYFHKSEGNGNRRHKRAGEVSQIVINGHGSQISWTPSNGANPHFTLGFCYQ